MHQARGGWLFDAAQALDLWSARGDFPRNMFDVLTREKEIRYSSRTRAGTDQFKYEQRLRHALADLIEKLPGDLKNSPEARLLGAEAEHTTSST
jgi:NTE family protein